VVGKGRAAIQWRDEDLNAAPAVGGRKAYLEQRWARRVAPRWLAPDYCPRGLLGGRPVLIAFCLRKDPVEDGAVRCFSFR
jgi:hypothetical protein